MNNYNIEYPIIGYDPRIKYYYPIGYTEEKSRELLYDENEEYESGDCYSEEEYNSDDDDDDDNELFQNSSALPLPILLGQLKLKYIGLGGRYKNPYMHDRTTPTVLGQRLKLWVKDKDEGQIELYFIAETSDLNRPRWQGYDYSNEYTLEKYTQDENIDEQSQGYKPENLTQKLAYALENNWKSLNKINIKKNINSISELLQLITDHNAIRKKLKDDANKSHIKFDIAKLKKDKLYTVLKFTYIDSVTKKKKTIDYQLIKIWVVNEPENEGEEEEVVDRPPYVKMYYIMSGTSDKLYGKWIGAKVKDQIKSDDPITDPEKNMILETIIPKFEILKKDKSTPIIPSGIEHLITKIAEHYYSVTHSPYEKK
jgi:hypothetical protein